MGIATYGSMVFSSMKQILNDVQHGSDIVYIQKTKPCIRKHLITKADRSLVDCLCECADNF
jgi:hypothetical protein